MENSRVNKRKIFNDPVYGFINIKHDIIFDVIEHPYFQRLRRIYQLGLTNYVYPGTNHTRFQHALGAAHLMDSALNILRAKGNKISDAECEAVTVAILLHDIGHGPFSHALEHCLIKGISHEEISLLLMEELNMQFDNKLELAINIYKGKYEKNFLHQLVASQLDMDRLDYLKRDRFFSGVTEGTIGSDRIIKMLNVVNDELVIEEKGIYSIEKFLIARRLMYWQVYLHKTALSAESLLIKLLKRAKFLAINNFKLFATPSLEFFLYNNISHKNFYKGNIMDRDVVIKHYTNLDDSDIFSSAKEWINHSDKILSILAYNLINRILYKIEIQNKPFSSIRIQNLKKCVADKMKINIEDTDYFVFSESISSSFYNSNKDDDNIKILLKSKKILDIAKVSDMLYLSAFSIGTKKFFLCYPKEYYEN